MLNKYVIQAAFLLTVFALLSGCHTEPGECRISTKIPGAKIIGFEEELETPVTVEKKGRKPIELEISQEGFHTKKVMWNPKMKETKFFVKLEPLIPKIKIETDPPVATIEHCGSTHKSGDFFELDYKRTMSVKVSKEGYKPYTVVIKLGEVQEVYQVVLEKDPVEFFYIELRDAVEAGDEVKAASLLGPILKEDVWNFGADYESEACKKAYKVNDLAKKYNDACEWEKVIFLLKQGIPGYLDPQSPIRYSFLEKAIEKDDAVAIRKLVEAGAERDAFLQMFSFYPDLFIAIDKKAPKALEELLKLGADPNGVYYKPPKIDGMSYSCYPLFYAVEKDFQQGADLLIQYGAESTLEETEEIYEPNSAGEVIKIRKTRKLVDNGGKWEIEESEPVEVKLGN